MTCILRKKGSGIKTRDGSVCAETISPADAACARCQAVLRPAAVLLAEPVLVPVAQVEVVVPHRRNWWLIGLSAAALLALVVLGLVLLLND